MQLKVSVIVSTNKTFGSTYYVTVSQDDSVAQLKERLVVLTSLPFPEQELMLGSEVLHETSKLQDCGVQEGSHLVLAITGSTEFFVKQLMDLLQSRDLTCEELGLLYCYKTGVSVRHVLKALSFEGHFQDFIVQQKDLSVANGMVSACAPVVQSPLAEWIAENQDYMNLHSTIASRAFNSKVVQSVNDAIDVVSSMTFLNIDRVVRAGAVGKGTAITADPTAEVIVVCHGLPTHGHGRWLPPLLRGIAGCLAQLEGCGLSDLHCEDDRLHFRMHEAVTVSLRVAPVFETYGGVLKALQEQLPESRRYFGSCLAEQWVNFVGKQSASVKATIRLLKWWRSQQDWSSSQARPSDELLELTTIHAAQQMKPIDQKDAVSGVLAMLSQFADLHVTWSNYYPKAEICPPLLAQKPLLMDPTNPYVNVADPMVFDPAQLMSLARSTRFCY